MAFNTPSVLPHFEGTFSAAGGGGIFPMEIA